MVGFSFAQNFRTTPLLESGRARSLFRFKLSRPQFNTTGAASCPTTESSIYPSPREISSPSDTSSPTSPSPFSRRFERLISTPTSSSQLHSSPLSFDSITRLPSNREHECDYVTLGGSSGSEGNHESLPKSTSECSVPRTGVSDEDTFDDMIRRVEVLVPGTRERTRFALALFDSGNPHRSLISKKLADRLRPSLVRRCLNKLAPQAKTSMATNDQAHDLVRGIDGAVIGHQDGTEITVEWFCSNPSDLRSPILHFQPMRYETTFLVVDAEHFGADIIFSWPEVRRLRLTQRFIAPFQRPPTPANDPDGAEFEKSQKRKEDNAAKRRSLYENTRSQQPQANARNPNGE